MKRITIFFLFVLIMLSPVNTMALTQNDRLMQRPELDGAVMQANWIEGTLRFQAWDLEYGDAEVWSVGPTFITSLPGNRNVELGGRIDVMNFDLKDQDDETGLSDIDIWGKYQLIKDSQIVISGGLLMSLPTGSDDIVHPHASGELNMELFIATRFEINTEIAAIAHVRIRKNSDMDVRIEKEDVEIEGETQLGFGGGIIYQATSEINLLAEFNYATDPYEEFDDDIQLRGGMDLNVTPNLTLRSSLAIGADDGAPEWEFTAGCAYLF